MNDIQAILKEYEEIRDKNRLELEKKKKELYGKLPRLKEIDDEMIKLGLNITKSVLMNEEKRDILLNELRKKQIDLKAEKAEILTANN